MSSLALFPLSFCGLVINTWHKRTADSFTAVVMNQPRSSIDEAISILGLRGVKFPIPGALDGKPISAQIEDIRFLSTGTGIEIDGVFVTDPIASSNIDDIDGNIF